MGDNRSHSPRPNCCICIQNGERVPADATVIVGARNYAACIQHAQDITLHGLTAAIKHATRNTTKGAV